MPKHSPTVRTLLGLGAVASLALPLLLAIAVAPMLPRSRAAHRFDGEWNGVACIGDVAGASPRQRLFLELSIDWGARRSLLSGLAGSSGTIQRPAESGTAGWTRRGLVLDIPLSGERTMSIAVNSRGAATLAGSLSILDSQHRPIAGTTAPLLLLRKSAAFARFVSASHGPCPIPARPARPARAVP